MWRMFFKIICLSFIFPVLIKGQKNPVRYQFSKPPVDSSTNELKKPYAENTFVYMQEAAFAYYPELESVNIRFKEKKLKTTMAARPSLFSVFRMKKNRVYYIYINNDKKNPNSLLLKELPSNAQVGVIGHEYAHILDYQSKSNLQLVGYGFKYVFSKKFKKKLENNIDEITISRGLGWQVYNFSSFVFNDSSVTSKYKAYKKKFYYTPSEILKQMVENSEVYKNLAFFLQKSHYISSF